MSQFTSWLEDNLLAESLIESVEKNELDELNLFLTESEIQLNEFLGLGKLAKKVGAFSEKADKKAEEVKKGVKEFGEKAKDVAKGVAHEVIDPAVAVAKTNVDFAKATKKAATEKATEIKDKFVKISQASKEILKGWHQKATELSPEQKKTLDELQPLYDRLVDGKKINGADAIRIIASVLAGSKESGHFPTYKAYTKQLETLRTLPGISSFKFTVAKN
jgi:hypothetical protein